MTALRPAAGLPSEEPVSTWLRLFADHADQVLIVWAFNPPRPLFVSSSFERIWKMPVSMAMERADAWISTIVPNDQSRVRQLYDQVLAGASSRYDVNYRIIDGHGAIRWIRDTGAVIANPGTGEHFAVGIAEDATELHRSAHELRQRAEWFSLLMEQVPFVLWTTDRKLRFTSSTGLGLRALGRQPDEVVGMSLFEYFQTKDHDFLPIRKHLEALRGDHIRYELEWSGRVFQSHLRPLRDANGEIVGVIGASLDMTEQIEAERALRESEETYRTLIENNPDLVLLIVDGRILFINSAMRKVTGYTPEEMIGRSPVEFIAAEDRERAEKRMREVLAGAPPRPSEYRSHISSGEPRTIEILSIRISYQGKPALVAFVRDVTERRQAEDEVRRHGEALERLVAERAAQIQELERQRSQNEKLAATGRMAARVAHEINNPLAGIKAAFRLIRDAVPKSHPHYEFVGRIDREIERIAHITQLMYSLYRPGSVDWQEIPVESCLRDIVSLMVLSAQKRGVGIRITSVNCPPVRLPSGYLEQILYNLIQNAVEASPSGKTVHVAADVREGQVVITVADEGPGIPADMQPHIFEPFYSSKGEGESFGLGLGLSVTRSLAESVGGSVSFESDPGKGTTFTVVLPLER